MSGNTLMDRVQDFEPKDALIALNVKDLLSRNFPPRDNLLTPWLPKQGLVQVYAYRGVGKTHFALGVGIAVASGGEFLKWKAEAPARVLYLDGEMPAVTIQGRVSLIIQANNREFNPDNFVILNPDLQEFGMPDLASIPGQDALKPYTNNADLIIVDNISTLCRAGAENKADDWMIVQNWALRMRATGKSVMFIHHAGKGGQQRGTSKREDVLDTVIALRHSSDYTPNKGAEFEVSFEKNRGFDGEDTESFLARLETIDNRQVWTTQDLALRTYDRVIELAKDGLRPGDIAIEIGCNKSTVSRHLKRAKADGQLK